MCYSKFNEEERKEKCHIQATVSSSPGKDWTMLSSIRSDVKANTDLTHCGE